VKPFFRISHVHFPYHAGKLNGRLRKKPGFFWGPAGPVNKDLSPTSSPGKTFARVQQNKEYMKNYASLWLLAIATAMTLSSCEVIGGIFKAGFWTAIIVIVLVVGLILWLVGRGRR
jgi:hypothetical protein